MSKVDLSNFEKKTHKIVTLFAKDGVNGQLTLSENIADFVGVQNSFQTAFPNQKNRKYRTAERVFYPIC